MGVFGGQFIDIIEWLDSTNNTIVYRFPRYENEIKMGAQLIVRESQVAFFVEDGKIADVFTAGRYQLSTQNLPILTTLKAWPFGFKSPFKAEVYFVSLKQFIGRKWGTKNPIMMRDQDFGVVRIRAYGMYSFRVSDPKLLLTQICGTNAVFRTETIGQQFKNILLSGIADVVASSNVPVLDLATQYDELNEQCKDSLDNKFKQYGFELLSFIIENISLPNEVEKMLDKRTGVGIMNDSIGQYSQMQATEAMQSAAQNPSGVASAGVGIGTGMAMADIFKNSFSVSNVSKTVITKKVCAKCGTKMDENCKFCPECGAPAISNTNTKKCVKCGKSIKASAKFCSYCGANQQKSECPQCHAILEAGIKFCPECGTKI